MNDLELEHIHNVLDKLRAYKGSSSLVLSVYLSNHDLLPGEGLANRFKVLIEKLTLGQKVALSTATTMIEAYLLNEYDIKKHKTNIAFFTNTHMWEVINHDYDIPSECYIFNTPYIAPLTESIQKDARYVIVVADREKAELFSIVRGAVEDYRHVFDPSVPQNVKSNKENFYARNDIIARHIQDHLHRHLQLIAESLADLLDGKPVQGVMIGGHKTLFADIKKHLPESLQDRIIGEFVTELNIPKDQIILHAQNALEKYLHKL